MRTLFTRAARTLPLALVLGILPPTALQAQVLTFEGLADQEPVASFYSGLGISFTDNALALIQANAGGVGNFGGTPSPTTALFFFDAPGAPAYLNVVSGFTSGLGFFYSAPAVPGTVGIFSGLNGTGTMLAMLMLPTTPNGSVAGCPDNPGATFCPFAPAGVSFTGTARSVGFSGAINDVGFDNVTLGSAVPMSTIPEPATIVLLGSGLLGLAGAGMLRRRHAVRSPQAILSPTTGYDRRETAP